MGEINSKYQNENFQALGIDVSSTSTDLNLGRFLNNAQAVDPNVVIDYPLLLNGNRDLGTSTADRDKFIVVNHEGIITHILEGDQRDYIGDFPMQELDDAIALAVEAASLGTEIGTLTLNFTGFSGPHSGQKFELKVVEKGAMEVVADTTLQAVPEGDFSLVFSEVIEQGKAYDIDYYADHNGNGSYDPPPTDHAWRITLGDVNDSHTENISHNVTFVDIGFPSTAILKMETSAGLNIQFLGSALELTFPQKVSGSVLVNGFNLQGRLVWRNKGRINQGKLLLHNVPAGTHSLEVTTKKDRYLIGVFSDGIR